MPAPKVRKMRADIGLGFGGDADRVIIDDERSKPVDGDQNDAAVA